MNEEEKGKGLGEKGLGVRKGRIIIDVEEKGINVDSSGLDPLGVIGVLEMTKAHIIENISGNRGMSIFKRR